MMRNKLITEATARKDAEEKMKQAAEKERSAIEREKVARDSKAA